MRLIEGEHWVATLRQQDQEYLGTAFVTLRRHAESLDALTSLEDAEFIQIRNSLIRAQMRAFGGEVVNVSCLMNEAFQQSDPSPHVHYHFKPRYRQPVAVDGEVFEDRQFGHYIRQKTPHPVSVSMGKTIIGLLKEQL